MPNDENAQGIVRFRAQRLPFTQSPNAVMRNPSISISARMLYHTLLSFAWEKGHTFPGQARLGEILNLSDRQVRTLTRELEELGLITVTQRGMGKTNDYWIEDVPEALTGSGLPPRPEVDFRPDRKWASRKEDSVEEDPEEPDTANLTPQAASGHQTQANEVLKAVQSKHRGRERKPFGGSRGSTGLPPPEEDEPPANDSAAAVISDDGPHPSGGPPSYWRGKRTWLDREPDGSDWWSKDFAYYFKAQLALERRAREVDTGAVAKHVQQLYEEDESLKPAIKEAIDLAIVRSKSAKMPAWKYFVYNRAELLEETHTPSTNRPLIVREHLRPS